RPSETELKILAARIAEECQDRGKGLVEFDGLEKPAARFQFDFAFGQRFFADGDADGKADEFGIFKFNAGAFIAIVNDDVDAFGLKFGIEFFSSSHDGAPGRDSQRGDTKGA